MLLTGLAAAGDGRRLKIFTEQASKSIDPPQILLKSCPSCPFFRYNCAAMHEIIQRLNDWYSHALQSALPLVAFMMAIESSLFPLPSES